MGNYYQEAIHSPESDALKANYLFFKICEYGHVLKRAMRKKKKKCGFFQNKKKWTLWTLIIEKQKEFKDKFIKFTE